MIDDNGVHPTNLSKLEIIPKSRFGDPPEVLQIRPP